MFFLGWHYDLATFFSLAIPEQFFHFLFCIAEMYYAFCLVWVHFLLSLKTTHYTQLDGFGTLLIFPMWTIAGLIVTLIVVVNWVTSLLSVTSSPGRWPCPWDSSCSPRTSRGSSVHIRGPAGLQRSLGGVLQAAGCILWTDRTSPWTARHSPARTGWYRDYRDVFTI